MRDKTFVVRIAESQYAPEEGEAVSDFYTQHTTNPSHKNVEDLLALHFSDWYVQVIPT